MKPRCSRIVWVILQEWLKSQLMEKEGLILKLTSRLKEQEQRVREIQLKYDGLRADYSNSQLQLKVDQLNRDLSGQKELQLDESPSKSGKKDKFSSAFVPSPFGSPKHF